METIHTLTYIDPMASVKKVEREGSIETLLDKIRALEKKGYVAIQVRVVLDTRGVDSLYEHDTIPLQGPLKMIRQRLEQPWNGF